MTDCTHSHKNIITCTVIVLYCVITCISSSVYQELFLSFLFKCQNLLCQSVVSLPILFSIVMVTADRGLCLSFGSTAYMLVISFIPLHELNLWIFNKAAYLMLLESGSSGTENTAGAEGSLFGTELCMYNGV